MYTLVDRESKGTVAVAAVNIRAGTVIFSEEPIFTTALPTHQPGLTASTTFSTVNTIDLYNSFSDLDEHKKARFLDLARPSYNPVVQSCLEYFEGREEWKDKMPLLTKICNVFILQQCGTRGNIVGVFEQASRLQHSCYNNCVKRDTANGIFTCRAVRNINAGEELTISYVEKRVYEPTHIRRARYMTAKGFTCHCPRCDALGDDTRRFNCFDARCQGSHLVCQPINCDPLPPGYTYDGVEYVEPHLLPCTACQRSPPLPYQAAMFQLEARLPIELSRIERQIQRATRIQLLPLFEEVFDLLLPRGHVLNLCAGDLRIDLLQRLAHLTTQPPLRELLRRCAAANLQCARIIEALLPGTAAVRATSFWACAAVPVDNLPEEKEVVMKALRINLILHNRENREAWSHPWDMPVQQWHFKNLPQTCRVPPNTDVCAFCEESPERAVMKRSRCGACKKVMYCSRSCQKAHWPVHKVVCGTGVGHVEVFYMGSGVPGEA
jgi:hypothetical protein